MKLMICAVMVGGLFLSTTAIAQDQTDMSRAEYRQMDSLDASHKNARQQELKLATDKENLDDLKEEKRERKAAAKDAQHVERDATDAARESRIAYRTEKKAQKMRKQADRQSEKAERARRHADKN